MTGFDAAGPDERDVFADQRRVQQFGDPGEVGDPGRLDRFGAAEGEPHPVRYDRRPALRAGRPVPPVAARGGDRLGDDLDEAETG